MWAGRKFKFVNRNYRFLRFQKSMIDPFETFKSENVNYLRAIFHAFRNLNYKLFCYEAIFQEF